jgi:hypothetical protein
LLWWGMWLTSKNKQNYIMSCMHPLLSSSFNKLFPAPAPSGQRWSQFLYFDSSNCTSQNFPMPFTHLCKWSLYLILLKFEHAICFLLEPWLIWKLLLKVVPRISNVLLKFSFSHIWLGHS